MTTITFGSLFAGIGGFDLGLERAGMVCKWQVEIDDFCQKVLAKHWPDVARYGDVRECGKHNLETVDLVCGGFPCQPHSTAGKRRGAADDRNLWPEYLRIITELNPAWVIGENVPGIITTILDEVLSDLEGADYEVLPLVIPACAVDAPHRRDRVWIVAYSHARGRRGYAQSKKSTWETSRIRNRNGSMGKRYSWPLEPAVGRVAYGIPNRVDRLRALGNAVVPQVAEWIGRQILEYESKST